MELLGPTRNARTDLGDSGGVRAFGGWRGFGACGGGSGELVTEVLFVG